MKSCLILLLVSGAALADDAALLHCRTVADGPARLACYNAIPVGVAAPAQVVNLPAAPAREDQERMFGKESSAWMDGRLKSIETRIDGNFEGWRGNQKIHLANGQSH